MKPAVQIINTAVALYHVMALDASVAFGTPFDSTRGAHPSRIDPSLTAPRQTSWAAYAANDHINDHITTEEGTAVHLRLLPTDGQCNKCRYTNLQRQTQSREGGR